MRVIRGPVGVAILTVLLTTVVVGAELQFSARVDRTRVGLGERFTLTVTVSGSGIGRVGRPKLPNLSGFEQLGSTSSQSTNISFVNGRITREQIISHVYSLAPRELGELVIGPCTLDFGGNIYRTEPIAITVVKEHQGRAPPARQQNPFSPFPGQPEPTGTAREDVHVGATVNRTSVYQGEQVTATYTFYTRLQIADLKLAQVPTFTGFWMEKLYDAEQLQYETREYHGQQYNAATIKRVALFPTRTGRLQVGAMRLAGAVVRRGGFFFNASEPFETASDPITIEVRPLPDSGRPPGFTGGVGSFDLSASLDRDSSVAGAPVRLTVRIEGAGNIQLIGEPALPRIPGAKVLSPETRDRVSRSGGRVKGSREFIYPIIPQADGRHVIPAVELGFFDPRQGLYYTRSTTRLEFVASGAKPVEPLSDGDTGARMLSTDIRHIKPACSAPFLDAALLGGWRVSPPWWAWLFYLAGAGLLGLGIILGRHRRKLEKDRGYARRRRSSRLVKKRLAEAARLLKETREREFHAALNAAVLGYVGDRFNIEAVGMTGDELNRELAARGVAAGTIDELQGILRSCDTARFSPAAVAGGAVATLERARRVLEAL